MDKITFRKRIYVWRTTKKYCWYLYINGIKNKQFYIEKKFEGIGCNFFSIIYFYNHCIVPNISKYCILHEMMSYLIFDDLYTAKQALLKLVYYGQDNI